MSNISQEILNKLANFNGTIRIAEEILYNVNSHPVTNKNEELRKEELLFMINTMNIQLIQENNSERMSNYFNWMLNNTQTRDWQEVMNPLKQLIRYNNEMRNHMIVARQWIQVANCLRDHTDLWRDDHYTIHKY